MKTYKILMLLLTVIILVSCRELLATHENCIVVYAPNNTVEVRTITQTRDKKTSPMVEELSNGKLHYVISKILVTDPGAIYYPDMDYNFYLTASNESEYYVFNYAPHMHINGAKSISIKQAFETYGADVIMNAIKEQSPQSVIIISSSQEQKTLGSFFQIGRQVLDLTIAE